MSPKQRTTSRWANFHRSVSEQKWEGCWGEERDVGGERMKKSHVCVLFLYVFWWDVRKELLITCSNHGKEGILRSTLGGSQRGGADVSEATKVTALAGTSYLFWSSYLGNDWH